MEKVLKNSGKVCVQKLEIWKARARISMNRVGQAAMKKEDGIDGILVTVGLCIIALLLCVVMKDSLKLFVETLVTAMTEEAKEVLAGVTP